MDIIFFGTKVKIADDWRTISNSFDEYVIHAKKAAPRRRCFFSNGNIGLKNIPVVKHSNRITITDKS
jgi:hypothetical protein